MLHTSNHKISILPRKSGPLMDFFGKIATPNHPPTNLEVNTMVSTVLVFFPCHPPRTFLSCNVSTKSCDNLLSTIICVRPKNQLHFMRAARNGFLWWYKWINMRYTMGVYLKMMLGCLRTGCNFGKKMQCNTFGRGIYCVHILRVYICIDILYACAQTPRFAQHHF